MRTKITLILLVCILVGCAKNADIESVNLPSDPVTQTVLPKISKDISVLSADDAIKVANLFSHGKVLTKSETLKDVRNVVPIKDASDRTLMYAVNYDDGYAIVSATKNYHPVLAVVDHGTYAGEKTGTGQDVLMNEYMLATEAAMDGEISVDKSVWSEYEEVPFQYAPQTKVSDEYNDVVNQYTGEWYQAGYNIYRLNQKPENMPDDMYAEFCDYASDYDRYDHDYMRCSFIIEDDYTTVTTVAPLSQTSWGQGFPYNLSLSDHSVDLGCTTIAAGQIMRVLEYPLDLDWSLYPNEMISSYPRIQEDTLLSNFLVQLRSRIGVNSAGGATIRDTKDALSTFYGYNNSDSADIKWNLSIMSHVKAYIPPSLDKGIPVLMTGTNKYSDSAHAWVCDGYRDTMEYTRYSLFVIPMYGEITELLELDRRDLFRGSTFFYHMNWGWEGVYDGYYLDTRMYINDPAEGQIDYQNDRKDMIFNKLTQ